MSVFSGYRTLMLVGLMFCVSSNAVLAQEGVIAVQQTEISRTPQVGETAPDFELESIDGEKVKLSEQTGKGPVVLVQLRGYPGYQCPLCTAQVGQFINKAEELRKANAQVVLVYPGPTEGLKEHADEFVRGKTMPSNFHLLLDPDFTVTNLYGLRWEAPNETSYPSTFVLDGERQVLFAKVSHSHGDRAKIEDVLAALPQPKQ